MTTYHVIELPELHTGEDIYLQVTDVWLLHLADTQPTLTPQLNTIRRTLTPMRTNDGRVLLHLPDFVPTDQAAALARELSWAVGRARLHAYVLTADGSRPIPLSDADLRAVYIDGIDSSKGLN